MRAFIRPFRWMPLLIFAVLPVLGLVLPVQAEPTDAERVKALTHKLISPCCWTTSVAEHGSGKAPVITREIEEMVAAGRTDQEILDFYVAQYGDRILAEPVAKGFNRLVYIMPWVAMVVGLGLIVVISRRRRQSEDGDDTTEPTPEADTPDEDEDPYRRRVREELEKL